MVRHGKKYRKVVEEVSREKVLPVLEVLEKVKDLAFAQFDESVDVDINLGIDPTKGEQVVRGAVVLPHPVGEKPKVLVFARDEYVEKAQKAGADFIGDADLIKKIKDGWLEFDYAVATPDMMASIGQVARILGPKGKLPNKHFGTVTYDIENIVKDLKGGKVFFRNDKQGIVHFKIGKVSFDVASLHENLVAFVQALSSSKPASSKGKFLGRLFISSTMGVSFRVNPDELMVRS